MSTILKGHGRCEGIFEGPAIVSGQPFGFWQGIDPYTGVVIDKRHDLKGQSVTNKAFIYPFGRGSTGTPGIFLEAVRNHNAPGAIVNIKSEPMIMVCALLAEVFFGVKIPVVDGLSTNEFEMIKKSRYVKINGGTGILEIE
jgi:uncharacterized protein